MTFTPVYHTQRAGNGYDLSVMRTAEGYLSLAIAYFHKGGCTITLTPDEEAALLAALTRTEQIAVSANWSGQPNPGASIPAGAA